MKYTLGTKLFVPNKALFGEYVQGGRSYLEHCLDENDCLTVYKYSEGCSVSFLNNDGSDSANGYDCILTKKELEYVVLYAAVATAITIDLSKLKLGNYDKYDAQKYIELILAGIDFINKDDINFIN